jgi:hypothetical protein
MHRRIKVFRSPSSLEAVDDNVEDVLHIVDVVEVLAPIGLDTNPIK